MSLFFRPFPMTLAAGLTLLIGAAPAAQAQIGVKHAAPTTKVTPQAQAVLNQMAAAYKALNTYSAKIAVLTTGGSDAAQKQSVTLSFQRPSRARAAVTDETGLLTEIVSDGVSLYISAPRDQQFLKQEAPIRDAIPAVLSQARGTLLPTLAGNPNSLARLFSQPGTTVGLGMPETIAGVPTKTVRVTLPNDGGARLQFTLSVSTGDHLLRRLTETARFTQGSNTHTIFHVETVTEQTRNPPLTAADFVFTPPPGAKKVASLQPPMFDPRLKAGARPFPIAVKDLNGRPLSLAQYKGKVVLLNFWATWCGPCVGEMPTVIAAYKKYHAQGFDVIGISLDEDKHALVSFLKQNKMPWRQVYDGKGWGSAVPRRYGIMAIPFGLLLNRDGAITAVEVGGEALPEAIKIALTK